MAKKTPSTVQYWPVPIFSTGQYWSLLDNCGYTYPLQYWISTGAVLEQYWSGPHGGMMGWGSEGGAQWTVLVDQYWAVLGGPWAWGRIGVRPVLGSTGGIVGWVRIEGGIGRSQYWAVLKGHWDGSGLGGLESSSVLGSTGWLLG